MLIKQQVHLEHLESVPAECCLAGLVTPQSVLVCPTSHTAKTPHGYELEKRQMDLNRIADLASAQQRTKIPRINLTERTRFDLSSS